MSSVPHRRADGVDRKSLVRAGLTTCAALAAGALAAGCVLVASGSAPAMRSAPAERLSALRVAASQPASSKLPAPSPAEGHSPRLMQELSGPLAGTGIAASSSATTSAATLQAAATATSSFVNGIDVSSYQHLNGAAINWTDVAASYRFAAIKATEGNYYINPYYASDSASAVAAGMYVSAYEFANPAESTGTAAATYTVENAGDYTVGGQYLPLMLDLEYNPYSDVANGNECYGLTPAAMVTWISDFMTEATTLTGAAPIIYTPTDWWDTCTGDSTAFGSDLLWTPSYSEDNPSTLPAGWSTWSFWQYTSVGKVTGITGDVDEDYFSGGPDQQTIVNTPASLQIETLNALVGQQVSYSATGLPPGLTMSSAGLITGTPTTVGTYSVTVTPSSSTAVLPATVSFTWTVEVAPAITSADQTTFDAGVADSFSVTATGFPAPTFSETGTLPAGVTLGADGVLSGTPAGNTAGLYPIEVTATNAAGATSQAFTLTVDGSSSYIALSPVRVLDTRNGTGGYSAPVGPGDTISLQITGTDGVPTSGVTAVVLNVTATDPTASSYVTVYPDGETQPTASNLNFTAGETIPNLVTVPVGSDGKADFYNNAGSVNLVADLEGYYTTTGSGSLLDSLGPVRVMDTRNGTGVPQAPVGPAGTVKLQVTGVDGVPASGVTAVVLNVTATDTTASSYVTVWPDGTAQPTASNLNFTAGETIPNLVVVPVGADGEVDFYNHVGSVDLVGDLAGYFTSSGTGSTFVAAGPSRVLDTRNGTGVEQAPVGPGATISLQVTGVAGVPASGVTAVVLNVTATGPTASSYVTVYADGQTQPTASNLNFTPGETIPNLVVVPVGADGKVDFYNHVGSVNLVADLAGYYISS
jgi:GH25 family lysozyme M1 (1,4-beta-N-acetylmuramidase)